MQNEKQVRLEKVLTEWYKERAEGRVGNMIEDGLMQVVFHPWSEKGEGVRLMVRPDGSQQLCGSGPEWSVLAWKEMVEMGEFLKTGKRPVWKETISV